MTRERNRFISDRKCGRCGWKFPSFHVCIDLTEPEPAAPAQPKTAGTFTGERFEGRVSEEAREKISLANRERWKTRNRARDEAMINRYRQGDVGYSDLEQEFGITRNTVVRVMKLAEKDGLVKIRRPGATLAKGAK